MTLGRDVHQAAHTHAISELSLDDRAHAATEEWRRTTPSMGPDVSAQLGERIATIFDAADPTFLAVCAWNGAVLARADLYVRDGIAQIEEVVTEPSRRHQGMASALVGEAIRRALHANARLIFLVADAGGAAALSRRLGFRDAGIKGSYARQL